MSEPDSTPASYNRDELDQIHDMLAKHTPRRCPICGGELESGGVFDARDSQEDVWVLTRTPCNRMAILRDVTVERT
jgi:hypothetical protein